MPAGHRKKTKPKKKGTKGETPSPNFLYQGGWITETEMKKRREKGCMYRRKRDSHKRGSSTDPANRAIRKEVDRKGEKVMSRQGGEGRLIQGATRSTNRP